MESFNINVVNGSVLEMGVFTLKQLTALHLIAVTQLE